MNVEALLERLWFLSWMLCPLGVGAVLLLRALRCRPATAHTVAAGTLAAMILGLIVPVLAEPGHVLQQARSDFAAMTMPAATPGAVPPTQEVPPASPSPFSLLVAMWLSGTVALSIVSLRGLQKVHRLARDARPTPPDVIDTVSACARAASCAVPAVRMVDRACSPMVSIRPRPVLLLPAGLWASWDSPTRRTIVLHELAHLRRRDHVPRLIAALAAVLYWWNPVVWWLRVELVRASESACDAWVTELRPQDRLRYAQALLDTQSLGVQTGGIAALSRSGRLLARRLRAIAGSTHRPRSSVAGWLLALTLSTGALFTAWTTVQVTAGPGTASARARPDDRGPTRFRDLLGRALLRITHPLGPEDIGALIDMLHATDATSRRQAADDLGNLLEAGAPAATALAASARADTSATVRREALDAIGRIGPSAAAALPALLQALQSDPDEKVRREAADALGRLGIADGQALTALRNALLDPSDRVQREARRTLRALDPDFDG